MAFFRRNPQNDKEWLVVELPEDVSVGDKVLVSKRGGLTTSVTIASIITMADGTRAATIDRKRKPKAVTCPVCAHEFEA